MLFVRACLGTDDDPSVATTYIHRAGATCIDWCQLTSMILCKISEQSLFCTIHMWSWQRCDRELTSMASSGTITFHFQSLTAPAVSLPSCPRWNEESERTRETTEKVWHLTTMAVGAMMLTCNGKYLHLTVKMLLGCRQRWESLPLSRRSLCLAGLGKKK